MTWRPPVGSMDERIVTGEQPCRRTSVTRLPTLADVQASYRGKPILKGKSRLEQTVEDTKSEVKQERAWKKAIWTRDGGQCRWCKRKVRKCLELVPDRGECHHVVPRENRITRWNPRAALLLCATCHQRVTGKVNERFLLVAKKTFTIDAVSYPDMNQPVTFKRIA